MFVCLARCPGVWTLDITLKYAVKMCERRLNLLALDRSDRESASMSTAYSVMMYLNCMPTTHHDKSRAFTHTTMVNRRVATIPTPCRYIPYIASLLSLSTTPQGYTQPELCGEMIADRAHLVHYVALFYLDKLSHEKSRPPCLERFN